MILEIFDATFYNVAEELGIKLAPRDDPEKSFAPSRYGTVLGIDYDSVSWTWALREDKILRILHLIKELLEVSHAVQSKIWTIAGKIIHVVPLVPSGRFNINQIILAKDTL